MSNSNTFLNQFLLRHCDYSREKAFALILAGSVTVNNSVIRDPKIKLNKNDKIEIKLKKYVSRGGFKLEKAIKEFNIDCKGKVVLDAGASSGGFTDCLLQNGASMVYSVDVGYNQLDFTLRRNNKVCVMEKTNIKDVHQLPTNVDFAVADLSFRSIVPVISKILNLTQEKKLIALLKPQFEIDSTRYPEFNGVISDVSMLKDVVVNFFKSCKELGYLITEFCESPITGGKGNREFLIEIVLDSDKPSLLLEDILLNIF